MNTDRSTCRFVQIADVHYVVPPHRRLDWPQLVHKLQEQGRLTELIDTMLPMALEQIYTELKPDFIIYTGDQVNVGWGEEGLANQEGFQALLAEFNSDDVPLYFVFGNHDQPRDRYVGFFGQTIYSFACSGCHFAVLDSGLMKGEEDPDILSAGLQELERTLAAADGGPAAVFLHFYIYPTDIYGYSYRAAAEAMQIIESHSRPVPVFNGHYHAGCLDVVNRQPYFTARSFVESPFCFYLHELSGDRLQIDEYILDVRQSAARPQRGWSGYRMCTFDLSTDPRQFGQPWLL